MAARHCCHATTAAALLEWESSFSLSAGSSPAARGVERRVCSGKSSGPLRARPSRSQKRMRKVRVVAGVVACSRAEDRESNLRDLRCAMAPNVSFVNARSPAEGGAARPASPGSPWALLGISLGSPEARVSCSRAAQSRRYEREAEHNRAAEKPTQSLRAEQDSSEIGQPVLADHHHPFSHFTASVKCACHQSWLRLRPVAHLRRRWLWLHAGAIVMRPPAGRGMSLLSVFDPRKALAFAASSPAPSLSLLLLLLRHPIRLKASRLDANKQTRPPPF